MSKNQIDMPGIKRILIVMVNEMGHLLPSFQIAKILQASGYSVVYGIQGDKIELIETMGFEYLLMPVYLFNTKNESYVSLIDSFNRLIEGLFNRISNYEVRFTEEQLSLFEDVIAKVNPHLVLLDSFLTSNYILLRRKPTVVLLQTMLSTYRSPEAPPLTSSLVPGRFHGKIAVWFEWNKYFLKTRLRKIALLGDTASGITNRLSVKRGIDMRQIIAGNKAFHVGLKDIPEVILAPVAFDFPTAKLRPNQFYAGLCLDAARNDLHADPGYSEFVQNIPADSIIVYCSLGTLADIHFNDLFSFYNKLINAFRSRLEILILSVGSFDKSKIKNIPVNVRVFHRVPQISMLEKCSMMITHGGLNSVLESIMCGRPMLVFPLNDVWDQNGNAARVIFHGIGLRDNIKRTSSGRINKQITELLENKTYKTNVERLRSIFSANTVSQALIMKVLTIATKISHGNE